MGCHFLLQSIFPTQGSNSGLLHCRQTLYRLSHQGSPRWCIVLPIPWPCCTKLFQSCLTLCDSMDGNCPGSSVHGILQARILGVGCCALLQGIFPAQGSNPSLLRLLHWHPRMLPACYLASPSRSPCLSLPHLLHSYV